MPPVGAKARRPPGRIPDYGAGVPRRRTPLHEVKAAPPERFDARKTLRRSGFVARQEAGRARELASPFVSAFNRYTGLERAGIGATLLFAGFTVLGLALLDAALRGRGPAAVEKLLGLGGQGIRRLFAANDPLIAYGVPEAGYQPVTAPPLSPGARAAGRVEDIRGRGPAPEYSKAGRLVPFPSNRDLRVDAGVAPLAVWIERAFGVKASSAYRSPARNEAVNGAPRSDHLGGLAVDFSGATSAMGRLAAWARRQGFAYVEYGTPDHRDHVHISFFRL